MEGHEASVGAEEIHGALEDGVHPADHAWACREPAGGALAEPRHTDDPGGARRVTDHGARIWRGKCPVRISAGLGDEEPVAEVHIVLGAQVAEPGVPAAFVEVRGEPGEALVERGRGELGEAGYAPAHAGIEIGVGPAPEGAEKAVHAIVRHEHRMRVHRREAPSDVRQPREAREVEVDDRGQVLGREPEEIPTGRVPGEDDHAAARHAGELGETRRAIRPVVQGEDGEGGVEGGVRKREVLGDGLHDRCCPGGRCRIISGEGSTAVTRRWDGS